MAAGEGAGNFVARGLDRTAAALARRTRGRVALGTAGKVPALRSCKAL